MTATVLGQTLGLKTNDQSNLSEVSSNLAVSVNASIRVGLNYDVEVRSTETPTPTAISTRKKAASAQRCGSS
ncbi:hypothetical protein WJ970_12940 [Achromobacter xylosoxidans]